MNIYNLQLGELGTNCYIIETRADRCVAVDIGGDADEFLNFIKSKNLELSKILLTHGHFDHMEGVDEVQKKTGAEVYIHSEDAEFLENPELSLSGLFRRPLQKIENYNIINDGDIIKDSDIEFKVMQTSGHTNGSVCYIVESEKIIFSGDTIFSGSIGRTTYPTGSTEKMWESLKKLSLIEGDYIIYPGHFESTTLKNEKLLNPYMREIMKGNI